MTDLLQEAIERYQAGCFMDAAVRFAALCSDDPQSPTLLRLHGLARVRGGDVATGVGLLARAHRLAPDDPLANMHLGIGQHQAGALDDAARLFRRAAALMPGQAGPWVNLAIVLLDAGDPGGARMAADAALAADPGSPDAQLALARACTEAGDEPAARRAFETCTRRRPDHAEGWVSFGAALYRFGDLDRATTALRRALELAPDHAAAHANMAVFEGLRGEPAAAIARLRDVLAREPGCVAARLNLANLLLHDRDADAVLALLPLPAPPGNAGRYWQVQRAAALLLAGRRDEARAALPEGEYAAGDAELPLLWLRIALDEADPGRPARIERLAAMADADAGLPEHRIIAQFNLAILRNGEGRAADAFGHWHRGHALLARSQPFERARYAKFFDASRQVFDMARLRAGPRATNADPAPLFIVGLPRSGTTLTEQILAAHHAVHGAGERLSVYECISHLADAPLTANSVAQLAAMDTARLDRAATPFLDDLHALAPGARYITDKMPGNGMHLGFLATLLPGARVILCERDLRDTGLSIFQRRFFGYHPYAHDLSDLGWYMARHAALMRHWEAVAALPILRVALADWIGDFDATLTRVLEFLDLPPDPNCARFYTLDRPVRTASRDQVRQPINASGLGRWRSYEVELAPMLAELAAFRDWGLT